MLPSFAYLLGVPRHVLRIIGLYPGEGGGVRGMTTIIITIIVIVVPPSSSSPFRRITPPLPPLLFSYIPPLVTPEYGEPPPGTLFIRSRFVLVLNLF